MTEKARGTERVRSGLALCIGVLFACLPALARQDTAAQEGNGTAEYWMGLIATGEPSLPEMTIVLTFRRAGATGPPGGWTATLDVPRGPGVTGAIGVRLKDVVYTDKEIKFASPPPPVENLYELTPSPDGKTARGQLMIARIQPVLLKIWRVSEPEALSAIMRRPQNPRDPLPYTERGVTLTGADGTALAGMLTLPGPVPVGTPDAAPAILLLGDTGPHNRDGAMGTHKPLLVWADQLTRLGIATLRIDDRGVGGSGGSYHEAAMETLAADALAGLDFLKAQPGVDRGRVGILGMGEGAAVAARVSAASKSAGDLHLLVLLAPSGLRGADQVTLSATRKMEVMGERPALIAARRERVQRMLGLITSGGNEDEARRLLLEDVRQTERAPGARTGLSEMDIQDLAERRYAGLCTPHMRSWLADDQAATLAAIQCDVLAIIGENDLVTPARENMDAVAKAFDKVSGRGVGEAAVSIQPGVNHWMQPGTTGFEDEYDQVEITISRDVLTRVLDWVGRRMDLRKPR